MRTSVTNASRYDSVSLGFAGCGIGVGNLVSKGDAGVYAPEGNGMR